MDDDTWCTTIAAAATTRSGSRDCIKDDELAEKVRTVEQDESLSPDESRKRVREAIEEQYTLPAKEPDPGSSRRRELS